LGPCRIIFPVSQPQLVFDTRRNLFFTPNGTREAPDPFTDCSIKCVYDVPIENKINLLSSTVHLFKYDCKEVVEQNELALHKIEWNITIYVSQP
jgi:hypothetical protein